MFKRLFLLGFVFSLTLGLSGCILPDEDNGAEPAIPLSNAAPAANGRSDGTLVLAANAPNSPNSNAPPQSACPYPAGWYPYQLQVNETMYSVAARADMGLDQLLSANCLAQGSVVGAGNWLYVPPITLNSVPQTLLPLGISALVADPPVVPAGGSVHITWQGQGPIISTRVGWVYNGQFIEEARNLPKIGTWQIPIPNDGREFMVFMVRASDGIQEVAAQTVVRVTCAQTWFFIPAPAGCPSPPLVTTFQEQAFERGKIIYIPAMGVSYVMVDGQEALRVPDQYVPGMPLRDPALEVRMPQGLAQPSGALNYAWRVNEQARVALGYAIAPVVEYVGMMQRAVDPSGERVYFSSGAGGVYRTGTGQAWGVVLPQ
jgi:hypothetical protein